MSPPFLSAPDLPARSSSPGDLETPSSDATGEISPLVFRIFRAAAAATAPRGLPEGSRHGVFPQHLRQTRRRPRHSTHAWLEQGSVIVDITADQFPEGTLPVIVSTASPWHEQFERESLNEADFRLYDHHTVSVFSRAYHAILDRLDP
jgi:hypothetical protein